MTADERSVLVHSADSLWRRLRFTPLSHLIRGRLTASLDPKRIIAAAALPQSVAELVIDVTRRTRLWRTERVEVARELAGHFRDGLDAGRSPDELCQQFGDLHLTARLIRRARLRNRPLMWRMVRRLQQGMAAIMLLLIVCYGFLAARYWLSRPAITHNFVEEINAPALSVPDSDRAWPLYRAASLQLTHPKIAAELSEAMAFNFGPDDPLWPRMLAHLEENRAAIQLVRQGAGRARFGFVFGDPADEEYMQRQIGRPSSLPRPDESLIQLLLPQMQELRGMQRLLDMDACRAVAFGDRAALREDLIAMLGVSNHAWDANCCLIGDLVSLACFSVVLERIGWTLVDHPELFSDADLRDISHRLSVYAGGGSIRLRLNSERRLMLDIFQRIYSDSGAGDGCLTAEGYHQLRTFDPLMGQGGANHDPPWYDRHFLGPAASAALAGRKEMTDLAMSLFDRMEVEQRDPLFQWQPSGVDREIKRLAASTTLRIRYLPVLLFLPAVQNACFAGELSSQRRDALLAALALELYHRRTGGWPAALPELTPGLLPSPPLDRFTGDPLCYGIVDGRPLLYSRGADQQDDGGTSPPGKNRDTANQSSGVINNPHVSARPAPGLDWILWPPSPLPPRPVDSQK